MTSVHVVPLRDLTDHHVPGGLIGIDDPGTWLVIEADSADDDCPCGPSIEHVANGWLITHHSLDGRELHEQTQGAG